MGSPLSHDEASLARNLALPSAGKTHVEKIARRASHAERAAAQAVCGVGSGLAGIIPPNWGNREKACAHGGLSR
jgi:hypothetical protein